MCSPHAIAPLLPVVGRAPYPRWKLTDVLSPQNGRCSKTFLTSLWGVALLLLYLDMSEKEIYMCRCIVFRLGPGQTHPSCEFFLLAMLLWFDTGIWFLWYVSFLEFEWRKAWWYLLFFIIWSCWDLILFFQMTITKICLGWDLFCLFRCRDLTWSTQAFQVQIQLSSVP